MSFCDDDDEILLARKREHYRKMKKKQAGEENESGPEETIYALFIENVINALEFTDGEVTRREEKYGPDRRLSHGTINLTILFIKALPSKRVVKKFIERSLKLWDIVFERDVSQFEKSINMLFHGLPQNSVKEIAEYILDRDSETGEFKTDVNHYWDTLERLVKLSIRLVHEKRKPVLTETGFTYTRPEYMSEVDICAEARKWSVDLSETLSLNATQ